MSGGPTVVYIAGSGRSGSTLLERTLGEIPGFVNVGELIDLFRRVAPRGERCGCGQSFADCPFWAQVGQEAFGGWDTGRLAATHQLQRQIARQRHLPRLLAGRVAGRGFRDAVAAYGAVYSRLYRAIAATAGARCVVDASKWPVQALALARAGLDVRVIHLVRDARGVAYSLGKADVARPHAGSEADVMWHVTPGSAAARWVACQSEAGLLGRCGLPVTRMRYEDFIREPRASTITALTALGLHVTPGQLTHITDAQVTLGSSHGLSGNPSRFRAGDIELRADEAWREQMRRGDRLVVTAITLPFVVGYARPRASRAPAPVPAKGRL
jgi:Sulfotransferase family